MASTYIRSSSPASLGASGLVSSLKFVRSTRFCADGMQIIVSTTSATIGSLGYHGEFTSLSAMNPTTPIAGSTANRVTLAMNSARRSLSPILKSDAALSISRRALNPSGVVCGCVADSHSAGCVSLPRSVSVASSGLGTFTKDDASTSVWPGNAAPPIKTPSSNSALATAAMNASSAGSCAGAIELAVPPMRACLSGVTPMRTPRHMPTSGGLISSRTILRHVANIPAILPVRPPSTPSAIFSPPPVSRRYPKVHNAGDQPIRYSAMYPAILSP
mmetsp:Transcript_13470/g.52924  ORF Transcript_13470/g.52924 Transcript_13470/m.52924 type:complete len:274 (+) Transcript_13470:117-938(+)